LRLSCLCDVITQRLQAFLDLEQFVLETVARDPWHGVAGDLTKCLQG
jgi:hypothetical protein